MSLPSELQQSWLGDGFAIWPMAGGFAPSLGPFLYREQDGGLVFRVEIEPWHCNGSSVVHGGFLATVADIVLAYNVNHRIPGNWRITTAGLSVQYLAPIVPGQWLEASVDRIKVGKRLCHASGVLAFAGREIVAMQGSFAVLNSAPSD